MVRISLVAVVVTLVAAAVPALGVTRPASAIGPSACAWSPSPLPLPGNTVQGRVTAGDGGWLAGTAGSEEPNEPDQGVLWHRGRLRPAGLAFGLDTYLHAVNADGIAVGRVIGADGLSHAIRYRTGYEYLPETGGSSVALDVNVSGAVVGFDGARRLVVWPPEGGPAHELPLPDGAAPYRTAAIDNDGTVVAWAGKPDATGTLRLRGYSWHPDGTRTAAGGRRPRLPHRPSGRRDGRGVRGDDVVAPRPGHHTGGRCRRRRGEPGRHRRGNVEHRCEPGVDRGPCPATTFAAVWA